MTITYHERAGLLSKFTIHNGIVYLSGTVGADWDADFEAQTRSIFEQIDDLLAKAGCDKTKILTLTCWLKNLDNFGTYNELYGEWIDTDHLPARATVQSELADPRLEIEIMLQAAV